MFSFIAKKLRFLRSLISESTADDQQSPSKKDLFSDLELNLQDICEKLGESDDLVVRRFVLQGAKNLPAALVYIDGLVDANVINNQILKSLMGGLGQETGKKASGSEWVEENLLTVGGVSQCTSLVELVDGVLNGDTALIIDSQTSALLIETKGWEKRGVIEPDTEVIVKGPRDGFTETLRINTAMLRRKVRHPSLTFEKLVIGKKTRTVVNIAYLQGLTNEKLVAEVRRRLKRINTDAILSAGFIEQYIEDAPFSPFITVGYTERPDVCAARILEGRVAILTDGTPVVNTVPLLFVESFQSPDDYNARPFYATFLRWFRYLSYIISILLPALYVALSSFHIELVPTPLLITMAAATEGTPFPAITEALGMGLVFEILREAGIRLPRPVGQTVSIVGALVIGEATVSAGLVGAPVVIVVAFTAITSFVVPSQVDSAAVLRFIFTILAGLFGAYGIITGLLIVFIHLAGLRSFGVPYLAPIAPLIPEDLKDVVARAPLWAMFKRPRSLYHQDPIRQQFRLMPEPPEEEDE